MRKLIYGINVTIDGCCDHTKGGAYEDVHNYFGDMMRNAGTLVYGRVTYQLMVPFWPDIAKNHSGPADSMSDFAQAFDAVEKIIVFSKTLEKGSGEKTTILRDNLKEEILKLKQEPGKDILTGGVDLAGQLVALDLVDEYHIVVQPIVAGEGRRLWDHMSLVDKLSLKLVESKAFKSGCVALRYQRP